jgi:hypothetical protein
MNSRMSKYTQLPDKELGRLFCGWAGGDVDGEGGWNGLALADGLEALEFVEGAV